MLKILKNKKGQLLIPIIMFSAIALVITGGIMNWTKITIEANRQMLTRERAIYLAESGIDYYRWHLAHAQADYQDGTGADGPYIHNVFDKDGNIAGQFRLNITPPPIGSTKVIIESTGIPASTTIERTIRVEMAIPSLAKYAVAANDVMRFGEGTEVFGPIHSNLGIRFDGLAHNIVTSAVASYNDPDSDDCNNNNSFGVHTCKNPADPSPPAQVPSRPDVFEVGRQFPVPQIDFLGLTNDLATIKSEAQSSGRYFAQSGRQGYQIIFQTNNTFNLYRVNSQTNPGLFCFNSQNQSGWATWSINSKTLLGNYEIPENGLIFVEDNLWVEGQIDGSRATVVAGRFPDNPQNRPGIVVNNNLLYSNYDGSDVLALISQGNINIGLNSSNTLRIDSALIAQNGRVGRHYYSSSCGSNYTRSSITLYGMIATYQRYGFAYTGNNFNCGGSIGNIGSGYCSRVLNYDANLLYGPPPSFPLTSDQYEILSWQEI